MDILMQFKFCKNIFNIIIESIHDEAESQQSQLLQYSSISDH